MKRGFRVAALVLVVLFLVQSLLARSGAPGGYKPDEGYEIIGLKSIKAHLSFLASNLLEGREATTRGYDIAADYAASLLQQYGLTPVAESGGERSFLQVFPVAEVIGKNSDTMQIITTRGDSQTLQGFYNRTHFLIGHSNRTLSLTAPIVFAGYGLVEKEVNYDDFANIDVRNKVVVVMTHAPGEGDEKSYFYKKENRNRFFNGMEVFEKQRNAQQRGALAVLLVSDPAGKHPSIFGNF